MLVPLKGEEAHFARRCSATIPRSSLSSRYLKVYCADRGAQCQCRLPYRIGDYQ